MAERRVIAAVEILLALAAAVLSICGSGVTSTAIRVKQPCETVNLTQLSNVTCNYRFHEVDLLQKLRESRKGMKPTINHSTEGGDKKSKKSKNKNKKFIVYTVECQNSTIPNVQCEPLTVSWRSVKINVSCVAREQQNSETIRDPGEKD
ncbi:hypothetical protein Hamer_G028541 [Homarus americanus]|uniref:Uncharacterized protein n=1 Tax=Homarus americanus TaxID=6706 RepID=A0A8J5KMR4_HOMAM|nr:hypothetical protein Hamer_G028541 [Homarus americanus]